MGRGRDAERKVPGPQGPATFRALRPAARVRRARAPTRRDVTATGRPARGLVWVSPGPAPPATPPSLPRWRRAGVMLPPASFPAPGLPPASVCAKSPGIGAGPEPRPSVGSSGDRLPPGPSPGPARWVRSPEPGLCRWSLFSVPARRLRPFRARLWPRWPNQPT